MQQKHDGAKTKVVPAEDKKKRTITEIRDSKKTGEKMVYMSVPDYTSAKWAEMAGVDVAVVGDSLAMVAHGHASTVPATMDMMILHSLAVRRGAPNTFVLGCMPYQSYNTVDRALTNATRFMQEALADAVKPQGGKSQAHILRALVDAGIPTASHIGLTPHTIAMFGGFKIQGRTADAAMKILEDALAIEDAGCFMLEFEAVPAKIATCSVYSPTSSRNSPNAMARSPSTRSPPSGNTLMRSNPARSRTTSIPTRSTTLNSRSSKKWSLNAGRFEVRP